MLPRRVMFLILLSVFSVAVFSGCATYQDKVGESRRLISSGNIDQAVAKFHQLSAVDDGDKLVHLLDYGVALQIAQRTEESTKVFLQADKLSENLDYHSVSRVAGSLLTSEENIQYKGDTFEKIFINAYLAMNFLELGKLDDALVESRRINEKYVKLRGEEKKEFELNPFAKYLSAIIWEANRNYDDAYIAFAEAYKLSPEISTIRQDLIRSAKRARRMDEYDKWKKAFPDVEEKPEWYDRKMGELVVIYQQGWGPRKDFERGSQRFPRLRPVYNYTQRARVDVISAGTSYPSRFVYDVERAAIKTLMEDRGALIGRRVGGIVAKEIVADQIRQKDELLGLVSWIFFHASDRADLRQWSLLPQTIQLIRVPLSPGRHKVVVQGLDLEGSPTGEQSPEMDIEIKPGQKIFKTWRSLK